jgi:hypothetical protein
MSRPSTTCTENRTVFFIARRSTVKIDNIPNSPKVALSVANNDSPYRYVIIAGVAEVPKGNLLERAIQIVARYRGREHGQARARDYIGHGCLLVEGKISRLTARSN